MKKNIPVSPDLQVVGANNPSSNRLPRRLRKRRGTDRFLPVREPELLGLLYKSLDDLEETRSVGGYPARTVANAGYRFSTTGCKTPVEIPPKQIVIAVKNIAGSVVALHNGLNRFFTARQIHFANIKRAAFTGEVEIFRDTVSADVHALTYNIAAVGLNGLTAHDLQLAIGHLDVRLDWRAAA